MGITVSQNGGGIPPTRRSRQARPQPVARNLEVTVVYTDGRSYVERNERNDSEGRKAIDRFAFEAMQRPDVDYIAVEPVVGRVAGYRG